MKTLIMSLTLIIALALPTALISGQSKGFHLSYNGRIYELREFKKAILSGIPTKVNGRSVKFGEKLLPMLDDILYQSAKHGVDPVIVVSMIWTESTFGTYNRSPAGAVGPMQIMQGTADDIYAKILKSNEKADRHDVSKNIEMGVVYLAELMKKFNKNEQKAIIAYNMGPGYIFKKSANFKFNHKYYNSIKARYDSINMIVATKGASQKQLFASKNN